MLGVRRAASHVRAEPIHKMSVADSIASSRRDFKLLRPLNENTYKPIAWTIPKPSQHAKDFIQQI